MASRPLLCSPGKILDYLFLVKGMRSRDTVSTNEQIVVHNDIHGWNLQKKIKFRSFVLSSSLHLAKVTSIFLRFILGISCCSKSFLPYRSCFVARRAQLEFSFRQFSSIAVNGDKGPLSRIEFCYTLHEVLGWILGSWSLLLSTGTSKFW